MKFRVSMLFNLILSVALVVSIAANLTGAVDYDPWLDVNDDGYGGIDDIVSTAEHFGASGDPTKLCNITNWPTSTTISVWYNEHVALGSIVSDNYNASGFGQLHVLVWTSGLGTIDPEVLEIKVHGRVPAGMFTWSVIVCTQRFNSTYPRGAFTIPVPSDSFYFSAYADLVTDCYVNLGFYLTWS